MSDIGEALDGLRAWIENCVCKTEDNEQAALNCFFAVCKWIKEAKLDRADLYSTIKKLRKTKARSRQDCEWLHAENQTLTTALERRREGFKEIQRDIVRSNYSVIHTFCEAEISQIDKALSGEVKMEVCPVCDWPTDQCACGRPSVLSVPLPDPPAEEPCETCGGSGRVYWGKAGVDGKRPSNPCPRCKPKGESE